jgi:hypothetical protein
MEDLSAKPRSGHCRHGSVRGPDHWLQTAVFKLLEAAQKSWRRLDGHNQLPKLVLGVTFNDGIEVIAKPTDHQPKTAAAWPARPSPKFSDSS